MSRALTLALLFAACGQRDFVVVDVRNLPASADSLDVLVSNGGQTSPHHSFTIPPGSGSTINFSLDFTPDRSGAVTVSVAALAGTTHLAGGTGNTNLVKGQIITLEIDLGGVAHDLAMPPDFVNPLDFSPTPPDLAVPDLAHPDFSLPDFSLPDLIASPITPSSIPGLLMWLEADVGASGPSVATWLDQSGNHNDAIQGNAALQPQLVAGVANGHPVLRFGGTQYLAFPGTIVINTNYTLMVVEARADAMSPNVFFGGDPANLFATDTTLLMGYYVNSANSPVMRFTQWGVPDDLDAPVSAWVSGDPFAYDTGIFDSAVGHSLYRNGKQWASNVYITGVKQNALAAIGAHSASIKSFRGDIPEVILYGVALSDAQRRGVELYLKRKYGL